MIFRLGTLGLILGTLTGCFCEPCREGAKYSDAIIAPNLEMMKIMRVPQAMSMTDCTAACCELSDCDLSWMFERHCYIVNCQHKGTCEPKKMEKVKSYLTFVVRPPRKAASLLGYGQIPSNIIHPMALERDLAEKVSNLKELVFLSKEPSLEEVPDYPDGYEDMGQNPLQLSIKNEEKEDVNYADWSVMVTAENGFNSSDHSNGDNWVGEVEEKVQMENRTNMNDFEENPVTASLTELPQTSSDLMGKSANGLDLPVPDEANSTLQEKVLIPSHNPPPSDILGVDSISTVQAARSEIGNLTEDEATSLLRVNLDTPPPATDQVPVPTKIAVRFNQLPAAVVSPKAQEIAFPISSTFIDGSQSTDDTKIVSYHWEEIEGPWREKKASADTPILNLSNLVPGNYTFRLTVIDSDGAANSTTASLRVNKQVDYPPTAIAGPNQAIHLPQNSIILNGNQSSDDHEIVSYEWSLSPKSKSKVVAMQGVRTPYLQLSSMQEGDYTFQLTVTDSANQQSTTEVTVIVQHEKNCPPKAVVGPDRELIFPVQSIILDGSHSTDDVGIVYYHWENISGPSSLEMDNDDSAVATVTGLQIGTYHFRLTVKDQEGLGSAAILSVTVKEESNHPPQAHAGGKHVLVLPNNSVALDGSQSTGDQGIVSYLWSRDSLSPAAGDVLHGSDHEAVLQLTNLVEGSYAFHLNVTDSTGKSDTDTAIVEVRPDPKKNGLVELILQVGVGQLSEQQKDTLVYQLAVLLNVLDSDIKVQKIHTFSDTSTAVLFCVQTGHPNKVAKASDIAQRLREQLLKKPDILPFKVLRVDTAACLLKCSGHGYCDPITKHCICYQLWMENLVKWYLISGESNCEWNILYVTASTFILMVLMVGLGWLSICCCKSRKRTKIRKKTKYTILDNIDDQERMELRPKYGIKHRSTEHNSSLMVSESEFDSDQDTIFSRDKIERENSRNITNGSMKNGVSFSYSSKDR